MSNMQPIVGIKSLEGLAQIASAMQEAVFAYNRVAEASSLKNIRFEIVGDSGTRIAYEVLEHPDYGIGLVCNGIVDD